MRTTQAVIKPLRDVVLAICVSCSYANIVMAESPCLKYDVTISGNFNEDSSIAEVDTNVPHSASEAIPQVEVAVPSEINRQTNSLTFRFVRGSESTWVVEGKSNSLGETNSKESGFHSPLAVLRFDKNGKIAHEQIINAFIGYADDVQRKAEFVVTFKGMTTSGAPNSLNVSPLSSSEQECPNFGRVVLSAEDAKKPENRMRLFDPEGREVTDLGYDVTGKVAPQS